MRAPSYEAAKAWAQEDFDLRILGTLSDTPTPPTAEPPISATVVEHDGDLQWACNGTHLPVIRLAAGVFPVGTRLEVGGIPATGSGETAPAGWKLVPVEPTEAMHKAAWDACDNGMQPKKNWPTFNAKLYRAMLAASPANPAETQAVEVGK